jgi:hypothetical protein
MVYWEVMGKWKLPIIKAKDKTEVWKILKSKYTEDFLKGGITITESKEEKYVRSLLKGKNIIDIEISGGSFVRHATIRVENQRRRYTGYDVYIATYERRKGGNFLKALLKVRDPTKRYSYQINGQAGRNTVRVK